MAGIDRSLAFRILGGIKGRARQRRQRRAGIVVDDLFRSSGSASYFARFITSAMTEVERPPFSIPNSVWSRVTLSMRKDPNTSHG